MDFIDELEDLFPGLQNDAIDQSEDPTPWADSAPKDEHAFVTSKEIQSAHDILLRLSKNMRSTQRASLEAVALLLESIMEDLT